jgi:hypothetical protein
MMQKYQQQLNSQVHRGSNILGETHQNFIQGTLGDLAAKAQR